MGAPLRRIQAGINHFDVNPLSWKFVRTGAAADEWRYADAQWVTALKVRVPFPVLTSLTIRTH